MNNNQRVILLIITVLVLGSVFLVTVIRSNSDKDDTLNDEAAVAIDADVNIDEVISAEIKNDNEPIESNAVIENDVVELGMVYPVGRTDVQSPDTGPGAIAVVAAAVISAIIATFGYRRLNVKNI